MSSFYGKGLSSDSEQKLDNHILNGEVHTSNTERQLWNNKVTVIYDNEEDTLIFSKAAEDNN